VRALVVVPQPPAAQGGAADRCTVGLVRALREGGVNVRVLAAHYASMPSYERADVGACEVVEVHAPSGWQGRVASVRRPVGALSAGAFAERVRDVARHVDVVHLEQVETAGVQLSPSPSPSPPGPPSVAHLHYRAALDRRFGPPWRRQFRQVLELTRAERAAAHRHRWLLANTPRVADTLRRLAPRAEVTVVPLTLDPDAYLAGGPPSPTPTAGLIGTGSWAPTAAAFDRLVHRVWPLVSPAVPGAELALAGRGTGYGEVDDATSFLRRLHVLVYPVERGSGMKVKTLEALALGVPVVTTPEGAEGVPPSDGVLVATDDAALAAHTARLLGDPEERRQRSAAARRTFDDHLSPAVVGPALADLYGRMVVASA
jgi:hypothetical protein